MSVVGVQRDLADCLGTVRESYFDRPGELYLDVGLVLHAQVQRCVSVFVHSDLRLLALEGVLAWGHGFDLVPEKRDVDLGAIASSDAGWTNCMGTGQHSEEKSEHVDQAP
jgi:hypothetical protein